MGIRHRIAHLDEQLQTLFEGGPRGRAVGLDRATLHIFHDHVGTPVGRDATVVETGDTGMLERRQDLPLRLEPLQLGSGLRLQKLDGDMLVEVTLRPDRFVDLAHAAASDQAGDAPAGQFHGQGWRGGNRIHRRRCRSL